EPAHFFLEQTDRVIELVASKRIRADELTETIRFVDGRRARGPHLVQHHTHAARRRLPRGFATGESPADDMDLTGGHRSQLTPIQASSTGGDGGPPRRSPWRRRAGHYTRDPFLWELGFGSWSLSRRRRLCVAN